MIHASLRHHAIFPCFRLPSLRSDGGRSGETPSSRSDRYQRAVLHYYETGEYRAYVDFFLQNHEQVISALTGGAQPAGSESEAEEIARRLQRFPELARQQGPARLFWQIAQASIDAGLAPASLNWPDIERRSMVESIAGHGHDPDGVAAVLCKYSPGAATPEKQQALKDDLKRLGPILWEAWRESEG
ncbi:MAG: hypothetical protein Q4B17_11770 [Lautropia sp.]|nr:hypothetical protein [Lautropia sp.]